jgi:hypothetical protein
MQAASDISQILSTVGVQQNSVASYTKVEQHHHHQLCYYKPKNKKQEVYSDFQLCNSKPIPNSLF